MILSSDVANILVLRAQESGLPVYQKGNVPQGEVTSERIVILPHGIQGETYWNKCFAEVNLIVPDYRGEADTVRLNTLEHLVYPLFDCVTSEQDGCVYHLTVETNGLMEDRQLRCHYINLRVQFNILNVK